MDNEEWYIDSTQSAWQIEWSDYQRTAINILLALALLITISATALDRMQAPVVAYELDNGCVVTK